MVQWSGCSKFHTTYLYNYEIQNGVDVFFKHLYLRILRYPEIQNLAIAKFKFEKFASSEHNMLKKASLSSTCLAHKKEFGKHCYRFVTISYYTYRHQFLSSFKPSDFLMPHFKLYLENKPRSLKFVSKCRKVLQFDWRFFGNSWRYSVLVNVAFLLHRT